MFRKDRTYLYHGTTSSISDSIIKNGIIPRSRSGVHDFFVDARDDVIYLTVDEKRAFRYGQVANRRFGNQNKTVLLIEVEVKPENLLPDESALSAPGSVGYETGEFAKVKDWRTCLALTGSASHKGTINPNEIFRISEIYDSCFNFRDNKRQIVYLSKICGMNGKN